MKRTFLAGIIVFINLALIGCGDGGSSAPPTFVTQILSDPVYDGDILQTSPTAFTITQGMSSNVQSVFAGIDPSSGAEYRAFLDFPLTGAGGVPGNAFIISATLDIVINNVFLPSTTDTIPVRIELVSIPGLTLVQNDFSRSLLPAIAFITIVPPISSADVGYHVPVDVTSLMVQAQNLGLLDFQVRILEDLGAAFPGRIEINDTTDPTTQAALAPLLEVTYK
jgi:hypothetical protein